MLLIKIAYAQEPIALLENINRLIVNPLISVLIALALVFFMIGAVEFILGADSEEKRKIGLRHITWGLFGLFVMVAAFGILNIICQTIGC